MRTAIAWTALALACAGAPSAKTPAGGAAAASPAAEVTAAQEAWLTTLDREHALVGKLWDARARAFVDFERLLERAQGARFVLLGERHDNPDHHRLQARVLAGLVQLGRRPAVVLEMLEIQQQGAIDDYLARPGASAGGFGAALGWEKTSWPPFAEYQPIFDVALAARLPIAAGNLAQADAKALVKQGLHALGDERVLELGLDRPFPAPLKEALLKELSASHCGHLPERLLAPMALAQHGRDAQMARVMSRTGDGGAVLIAGSGHARRDRGVPHYLSLHAPGASIVSLALLEVEAQRVDAAAYVPAGPDGAAPFDFVWFTPRASDEDPCAAFRAK